MSRRFMLILVALVIVVGLMAAFAGLMNQQQNKGNNDSNVDNQTTNNTVTNTSIATNVTNKTIITPQEAQEKAQKYIAEPGATAGTPKLFNESGGFIYVVPVVMNNKTVGEIEIDARTGENLGGSGG
jgi:uncharacterized membrane protein YkoI